MLKAVFGLSFAGSLVHGFDALVARGSIPVGSVI
jgi:hypothetical protein